MKFMTVMVITLVIVSMSSPRGFNGVVAQSCVPTDLMSCLPAMISGGAPSTECCDKLKVQEPCLCSYIKNPMYSSYVSSQNARKTLTACNIPYPTC
ncbi:hypothetical protein CARUB_v10019146mg [Capsella rubella]|uniref:Bifunctional inhibitor/plant lipid transfer protein/seed storage helical domain-containing protein n=1 Tax=Capsella rubella TaxID=81985 RepID=R0H8U5_9BRAS|nr:non-specific lipid-transfer protein 2 [Capsella rubella]EOA25779.1 hypothetical protein CARUB_v10019146mg [Capsella rubella]